MLELTRHFVDNWMERVDPAIPDTREINRLIGESRTVQEGREVKTRYLHIKTLTIYWHVEKNLIITADLYTGKVVSVYTEHLTQSFGIGSRLGAACHG